MRCTFLQILLSKFFIIVVILFPTRIACDPDESSLFSKIVITSDQAHFSKNENHYIIRYEKNVRVDYNAQGSIKAQSLDIVLNALPFSTQKQIHLNDCKSVHLNGGVELLYDAQRVRADEAEIVIEKQECILKGNVKIERLKTNSSGQMPLAAQCNEACFNFVTKKIILAGTSSTPVITTFTIDKSFVPFPSKPANLTKK